MEINDFPIEILENIFTFINSKTNLEMVCKKWNNICKNNYMIKYRSPCSCHLSPYSINKCISYYHECICIITPHHTIKCRAKKHTCVCNLVSILNNNVMTPNYTQHCKSIKHPCVCHLGGHFKLHCKCNSTKN